MHFTIRHAIPGRIRIQMPALEHPSPLTQATIAWLRAQEWVVGARLNHGAASLIVEYDPAHQEVLDDMLMALRHADIDDLCCLVAPSSPVSADGPAIPTPGAGFVRDGVWGGPLALPTVSLALSFLTSPAALAINIPLMLFNGAPIFQRAWRVLTEERRLNIDLLDTLAIAASIYQGSMITGGIIVWLIRLGDWIRDLTAAGSRKAISELLGEHHAEMARAVDALKHASFAVRLAELAGQPVNRLFAAVPSFAAQRVNRIVERAIRTSLDVAISSMDDADRDDSPSPWVPRVIAGVTGGLGGLFGIFALPVELPLTTMVMLRSIAEIAQSQGEDLSALPSRLACLEVLALGTHGPRESDLLTYYALRATLARLTHGIANLMVERGTTELSATLAARVVATISSRFGPAVAERLAATAVPVVGLIGGATVNMVFMEHYQRLARGHFTIRRLERRYGATEIETLYRGLVAVERRG